MCRSGSRRSHGPGMMSYVSAAPTHYPRAGYTHAIALGANDLRRLGEAATRYSLGGDGYVDPVPFDKIFEIVNGTAQISFVPVITVSVSFALP